MPLPYFARRPFLLGMIAGMIMAPMAFAHPWRDDLLANFSTIHELSISFHDMRTGDFMTLRGLPDLPGVQTPHLRIGWEEAEKTLKEVLLALPHLQKLVLGTPRSCKGPVRLGMEFMEGLPEGLLKLDLTELSLYRGVVLDAAWVQKLGRRCPGLQEVLLPWRNPIQPGFAWALREGLPNLRFLGSYSAAKEVDREEMRILMELRQKGK